MNHGTSEAAAGTVLGQWRSPTRPVRSRSRRGRDRLYTQRELNARTNDGRTVDQAIGDWFHASGHALDVTLARAVHDPSIDAALARHLLGRSVVGVMGGHGDARGSGRYVAIAAVGRALARSGYLVATGGGPGLMEAANLGAWIAAYADDDLDAALDVLTGAPTYSSDRDRFVSVAGTVRERWPAGGDSLGVPTWVYADEPTSAFCDPCGEVLHQQHPRRRPAGARPRRRGVRTRRRRHAQEIFTDTAQNTNTLYEVRSPMVFFEREFYEEAEPELLDRGPPPGRRVRMGRALHRGRRRPTDVLAFLDAHDPDDRGQHRASSVRRRPDAR